MKKRLILIILSVILSLIITFVLFEALSWYHFGDVPTVRVVFRLLGFFCALEGLSLGIISLITSRKQK